MIKPEVEQINNGIRIARLRDGQHRWYETDLPALKGERLPGSTTIVGLLSKEAIAPWARRVAVEAMLGELRPQVGYWIDALLLERAAQVGLAEPERVKKEAGDYGTRAHALIAEIIRGGTPPIPDDLQPTIRAFQEWQARTGWEIDLAETLVVSHSLRIGTQIDGIGRRHGQLATFNWKTGNGIFWEMAVQAAAEWTAYRETFEAASEMEAWVVRLGKTRPVFYARRVKWPDVVAHGFWCLRQVYDQVHREAWYAEERIHCGAG